MSLTVDICGKLENVSDIEPLMEFVRKECEQRNWPYRFIDDVVENVALLYTWSDEDEDDAAPKARLFRAKKENDALRAAQVSFAKDGEVRARLPRRGIMFRPHYRTEVVALVFDTDTGLMVSPFVLPTYTQSPDLPKLMIWDWHFAKTVYAGAEVHCQICDFLKEVMQRFPGLRLTDTGDYILALLSMSVKRKVTVPAR